MSIARINEFKAKQGLGDALREHVKSFVPMITASPGCLQCNVLQSEDDPDLIVVFEMWESVDAHMNSVKNVPPESLEEAMDLMDAPPRGGYFVV